MTRCHIWFLTVYSAIATTQILGIEVPVRKELRSSHSSHLLNAEETLAMREKRMAEEENEDDDVFYGLPPELKEQIKAHPDIECEIRFKLQPYPSTEEGQVYCNSSWDSVTCWPTTLGGQLATAPCPPTSEEYSVVKSMSTKNATHLCLPNGTWEHLSDYKPCVEGIGGMVDEKFETQTLTVRIIYYAGYSLSTLTLIIALSIFCHFKSLRCLRNTIHCHLIMTFILRNVFWIIMNNILQATHDGIVPTWICKAIIAVFNYLQTTNFFWMFVEGLYLHMMIVWAYKSSNIKTKHYAVIGWGIPIIFIILWICVKSQIEDTVCWLPMKNSQIHFIYITPVLVVLFINIIFLSTIVWVLVLKIRASHSIETRQYRKAAKSTLILFPLLGLTYVLFITPPGDDPGVNAAFLYFNAILQSLQGFFVSLFYCFLNGEVRNVLKQRYYRWLDQRTIGGGNSRMSVTQIEAKSDCESRRASRLNSAISINGRLDIPKRKSSQARSSVSTGTTILEFSNKTGQSQPFKIGETTPLKQQTDGETTPLKPQSDAVMAVESAPSCSDEMLPVIHRNQNGKIDSNGNDTNVHLCVE
ncbi:unnamed protein product [Owenia fusiformis]|uniref:Uncharacterized protein n=1 Tax=Owenia fusiformis TaxID=6347 RepID=A0A8S4PAI3_OWEFU|nr:unnamed protein product [Owenia fusiformis]